MLDKLQRSDFDADEFLNNPFEPQITESYEQRQLLVEVQNMEFEESLKRDKIKVYYATFPEGSVPCDMHCATQHYQ